MVRKKSARARKRSISLGIIGCGNFVRSHVRAINDHVPEFDVVALADPATENAERLAGDLPDHHPEIYADHEKLLKAQTPDAVIVSSPHTLHFGHGYDALGAGAHVMVEKPMVTNSDDARKLVRRAKRKKLICQIAIQGTYTDTFAYARRFIADGKLGELQLVTGIMAQGWKQGTKGKWRQKPELSGGGQLYDSSAHVLSAMMYLVDSPVREVFCFTDNKGTKVDINAVACIRFANGCMGSITSGGNCPTWKSHLTFQGDKARMEISPHGGDFLINGRGLKEDITAAPKSWKIPTVTPARNFADAILNKAKPRCAGRLGIMLADLMDALYESADRNEPVRVTKRLPKE